MAIHSVTVEPVAAATISVQNASYYTNGGPLNDQIQAILNSASSGDTINFLGDIYQDLHLTITKRLTIITTVGTELLGSGNGAAVFTINGFKASGTRISGFNINETGIIVNNTSNVTLSNTTISSASGSAVNITQSANITVRNSSISNSSTGITVSNSKNARINGNIIKNNKKDGITLSNSLNTSINRDQITDNGENGVQVIQSNSTTINNSVIKNNGKSTSSSSRSGVYISKSQNVKVIHNTIQNNYRGVYVDTVTDTAINHNYIIDNDNEGILATGNLIKNLNISSNDIERNLNGVTLNYLSSKNGKNTLNGNIIAKNGHGYEGNGIYLGPNYAQSGTDQISHNAIYGNIGWDVNGHDTPSNVHFDSNFFGDSPKRCCAMQYDEDLQLRVVKIGNNLYAVAFYDPVTNSWATDFPDGVSVMAWSGGSESRPSSNAVSGTTKNGAFTFTMLSNEIIGTIFGSSEGVVSSVSWNDPINTALASLLKSLVNGEGYGPGGDSGGDGDDPGNGSGDNPGDSHQGSHADPHKSNSISSKEVSSSHPTSLGLAAAGAAAGNTGSAGQSGSNGQQSSQTKDSKTAQELFVDKTVKNPQFWEIIGIVALLIVIFGAYYRKDLMAMVKKSKK